MASLRRFWYILSISIHAPVKGATRLLKPWARTTQDFNPRTREGCDFFILIFVETAADISIHAPVKGATRPFRNHPERTSNFNPRTREGCDTADTRKKGVIDNISIHAPVKGATTLSTI